MTDENAKAAETQAANTNETQAGTANSEAQTSAAAGTAGDASNTGASADEKAEPKKTGLAHLEEELEEFLHAGEQDAKAILSWIEAKL